MRVTVCIYWSQANLSCYGPLTHRGSPQVVTEEPLRALWLVLDTVVSPSRLDVRCPATQTTGAVLNGHSQHLLQTQSGSQSVKPVEKHGGTFGSGEPPQVSTSGSICSVVISGFSYSSLACFMPHPSVHLPLR